MPELVAVCPCFMQHWLCAHVCTEGGSPAHPTNTPGQCPAPHPLHGSGAQQPLGLPLPLPLLPGCAPAIAQLTLVVSHCPEVTLKTGGAGMLQFLWVRRGGWGHGKQCVPMPQSTVPCRWPLAWVGCLQLNAEL